MKDMKKEKYENIIDFCEDFVDTYEYLDEDSMGVSVIAKYEEAKEILSCLCLFDYNIHSIEIESPDWDGYDDEYIISLANDLIFCKKNKRNEIYICSESDYVFVFDDCNSKCLEKISANEMYEVSIFDEDEEFFEFDDDDDKDDDDDYFEDDCDYDVFIDDDDDNMHGFTMTRNTDDSYSSVSFYSTEKLCACELQHLMDIFGF